MIIHCDIMESQLTDNIKSQLMIEIYSTILNSSSSSDANEFRHQMENKSQTFL